jgi:hypothetical protein
MSIEAPILPVLSPLLNFLNCNADLYYLIDFHGNLQVGRGFVCNNRCLLWIVPGRAGRGGSLYWNEDQTPNNHFKKFYQFEFIEENLVLKTFNRIIVKNLNHTSILDAQLLTKELYDQKIRQDRPQDFTNIEFIDDQAVQNYYQTIENDPWGY